MVKLEQFRKLSTEQLLDSLKGGQACSLKARPDGTLIEGNHRIKVLRERGIDVDSLPREIRAQELDRMTSYQIEGPWPGQLAIVPRPRGGDWLTDELRSLKDEGFDVLVSLLTEAESEELGLVHEADLCRENGLAYFNFPIPDLGVPESGPKAQRFVGELHGALMAGKKVAVHCRQGIGRSGLVAASLLVASGMAPESAFRRVSVARGLSTPETLEQKDWVVELARELIEPLVRS